MYKAMHNMKNTNTERIQCKELDKNFILVFLNKRASITNIISFEYGVYLLNGNYRTHCKNIKKELLPQNGYNLRLTLHKRRKTHNNTGNAGHTHEA